MLQMLQTSSSDLFKSLNHTQKQCLDLLCLGNLSHTQIADTLGITPALISQYLKEDNFSAALAEQKLALIKNNSDRDSKLDSLEDTLVEQLKSASAMAYKPLEIARLFQVINAAKRRGIIVNSQQSVDESKIIKLVVPTQIINKFKVNVVNQVVTTGETSLVTIQSGAMRKLAAPDLSQQFIVTEEDMDADSELVSMEKTHTNACLDKTPIPLSEANVHKELRQPTADYGFSR